MQVARPDAKRSPRILICCADSSPDAYRHRGRTGQMRCDIQHQRGFSDPWISAQQHQRAGDNTAAQNPIEFGDSR